MDDCARIYFQKIIGVVMTSACKPEFWVSLGGLVSVWIVYHRTGKETRICGVVDSYLASITIGVHRHIEWFYKAGVCDLKDDVEIREARDRIISRGEEDPLIVIRNDMEGKDLHKFFMTIKSSGGISQLQNQRWNKVLAGC